MTGEPSPPIAGLPRYAPSKPFPPYRFVPGRNAHPTRDPRGHSYRGGAREPLPPRFAPERWRENEEYLYGCDLYNAAYWWEAHEAWEGLWHLTRKSDREGLFLQGLIQVSAASLKRHLAEPEGTRKLARLGLEKLRAAAPSAGDAKPSAAEAGTYMGLAVSAYADAVERFFLEEDPAAPWPAIHLESPIHS
ncbi:MAG TPA: DUF309 domain-containing protein [Planctomycetota bacterium]|nr:DUF309 domain-containing protein [Planctomycetota bacterium]